MNEIRQNYGASFKVMLITPAGTEVHKKFLTWTIVGQTSCNRNQISMAPHCKQHLF